MSTENRSPLLPVAAVATAAALWVMPATAEAQPVWASTGVAFSVSVGRQIEVGVAMDLRLTVILSDFISYSCGDPTGGLGPYGQAGWYSRTGWRFGAGLHGGVALDQWPASFDGELGWSYRRAVPPGSYGLATDPAKAVPGQGPTPSPSQPATPGPNGEGPGQGLSRTPLAPARPHDGSHGLHFGVITQLAPPELFLLGFQLPLGFDLPLSNRARGSFFTTGVGIRFPSTFGFGFSCIVGRPLRENGVIVLPEVQVGGPCARRQLDESLASGLAAAWLEDARSECASIPVFYALARDLAALGAPPALIARALTAAAEEVHHTVLCSQLAASFAGITMCPMVPPVPAAKDADREAALCRLASEAWLDGCLGEGAAAAQALCALSGAADEEVRRALSIIACDEAGHAELAWSVLAFCLRVGGRSVYEVVATLVRADLTPPECVPPSLPLISTSRRTQDPARLRAFGRIPPSGMQALWQRNAATARPRALRLLFNQGQRQLWGIGSSEDCNRGSARQSHASRSPVIAV